MSNLPLPSLDLTSVPCLRRAVDHVDLALATIREHRADGANEEGGLNDLQTMIMAKIRENHQRYSRCRCLPSLVFVVFCCKCPLVASLQYSLFIPTSMSVLLFFRDIYWPMMLASFLFEASGGGHGGVLG